MGKPRLRMIVPLIVVLVQISIITVAVKLPQNPNPKPLAWWQEEIVYQVYPRSHQDSNGDGVGDLAGIQSKLNHFVNIGVGAVWISPIYKSPMKDFGYDISNFTDIEPTFGTIEDFKSLSAALKANGIRLVMDFVPNHSSDLHPWFNKSISREEPYTNYYVWKDAKGREPDGTPIPPNNWVNIFGGSMWDWNEQRGQFYLHQFLKEQPDLNFENPRVLKEILAVMKIWLDYGVDGFRVDAVPHLFEDQEFLDEQVNPNRPPDSIPFDYAYWEHKYTYNLPPCFEVLAEMRKLLDIYTLADGKERVMMVESTVPAPELFEYYGTPEKPIAHFPFNFELINRVPKQFNGNHIESVLATWFDNLPEGAWANWLAGNHDNNRVASRFSEEYVDFFNMLVLLLPGNAVTYYGEELGMHNANISWEDTVDPSGCNAGPERYHLFSRDPERTPMHWNALKNGGFSTANKTWLPMHPDYLTVNVEAETTTTGNSHLKVYTRLAQLRKTDTWRYGSLESSVTGNGDIFGFARIYNGKGYLVMTNTANEQKMVNAQQEFDEIPAQATVYATSVDFKPDNPVGTIINTNAITLGAQNAIVLEF